MRASPARIMAEIRAEHELSVRDAWQVYRETRDVLKLGGERPSLAAFERASVVVQTIVRDVTAPPPERFEEDYADDYSDFWELTAYYEG